MPCDRSYEECVANPHPCMKHKLRYWRETGVGIALPDHDEWTGPTVRERVADTIETAKANGYEPEYVGRATLV